MKVEDSIRALKTQDEVEAHFKLTTFSSQVPAMIGKDTTIVAVNPAFIRAVGASGASELVGHSTDILFPESQPGGIASNEYRMAVRQTLREHGFHRYSIFLRGLDDCPIIAEVASHRIDTDSGYINQHVFTSLKREEAIEFRNRSIEEVIREIVKKSAGLSALLIDGQLVEASESMLAFLGFSSLEESPQYSAGMFSPEFQPDGRLSSTAIVTELEIAAIRGDHLIPWVILDGNSVEHKIEIHATLLSLNETQAFLLNFRQTEGDTIAIKTTERLLEALDKTTDALYLVDLNNTQIVDCNRVAHEMLGYTKSEFLNLHVPELVPKEFHESNREHLGLLKQGKVLPVFESIHLSKTGEEVPVLVSANKIDIEGEAFALASVRDLQKEKVIQNATQDLKEQFEIVGELLPVGIYMQTIEDGNIYVNEAWTRITGISRQDAAGDGWQQMFAKVDIEPFLKQKMKELHERGMSSGRMQLSRENGDDIWVEHKSVMLKLSDGSISILGTVQDVTETEQRQNELEIARSKAEEANEAKSKFLSQMSHELRTPLNAVLGFTQLLRLDELSDSQKDAVAQIEQGGVHLLRQIEDLLNLSRIEHGKLELHIVEHEAAQMINSVVKLLQNIADNAGIKMIVDDLDLSIKIKVDQHRFRQIILNLLSNAIKYNESGGEIRIKLKRFENQARIQVDDTGFGIPEDQLQNLFVPFDRLGAERSNVDGLGIGLALAKELTNLMGGEILADSKKDVGTKMTLLFPLS